MVTTGHLDYYDKLKASIPPGHLEMLRIPWGLRRSAPFTKSSPSNPRRAGIHLHGKPPRELPGFGAKTQQKILTGIGHLKRYKERHLYSEALIAAEALLGRLRGVPGALREPGGPIRRGNETVKDIDTSRRYGRAGGPLSWFAALPHVERRRRGDTKVSVFLKARGSTPICGSSHHKSTPSALHHFTGSKEHNVATRGRASSSASR